MHCPFCQTPYSQQVNPTLPFQQRTVNLEKGMPLVQQALERLRIELETAKRQGVSVLTLIHGYGSSGKGGLIKEEVRNQLQYLFDQGNINDLLPGEAFHRNNGKGKQLLRRFPELAEHRDFGRMNRGVTLVIL